MCAKSFDYIVFCTHCMCSMLIWYHRPTMCAKSYSYIALCTHCMSTMLIQYHRPAMCAKSYNYIVIRTHCMIRESSFNMTRGGDEDIEGL